MDDLLCNECDVMNAMVFMNSCYAIMHEQLLRSIIIHEQLLRNKRDVF